MNVLPDKPPADDLATRTPVVDRWFLSALIPGLGQFVQRRFFTGAGQLGTVLAYSATAIALGSGRALLLAVAWNVWSAIDAYRHERP
jgi:hypothetical protein